MPVSIPIFILRDFTPVQIKVFSVLKGSLAIDFLLFQFKCRVDNREVAMYYFTGVLYLHNGFVRSKKKEFMKSFLLKETEYIGEDFKAEIAHTLFDVM